MPKEGEIGARLKSGDYELVFAWAGDRFGHVVQREKSGQAVLEAIEAPSLETPVFQEVHQQGELVFGSGMSGDRHWSLSVEPCDGGFLLDVACRYKSAVAEIGSAYRQLADALHVVGVAAGETAPPRLRTEKALVSAVSGSSAEPPATLRYRYMILKPQGE